MSSNHHINKASVLAQTTQSLKNAYTSIGSSWTPIGSNTNNGTIAGGYSGITTGTIVGSGYSYASYSTSPLRFPTNEFIKVQIVNLKDFKKNKTTGVVFYDNLLLEFGEFYKMVKERREKGSVTNVTSPPCPPGFKCEEVSQKVYPKLYITLEVPCDCEICQFKQSIKEIKEKAVNQIVSGLQNGAISYHTLSQWGTVGIHSAPTVTVQPGQYIAPWHTSTGQNKYQQNYGAIFKSAEESLAPDMFAGLSEKEEGIIADEVFLAMTNKSTDCVREFDIDESLFLFSPEAAARYFTKVAKIHEKNSKLINPHQLNLMEIKVYKEKLRINTHQHFLNIGIERDKLRKNGQEDNETIGASKEEN